MGLAYRSATVAKCTVSSCKISAITRHLITYQLKEGSLDGNSKTCLKYRSFFTSPNLNKYKQTFNKYKQTFSQIDRPIYLCLGVSHSVDNSFMLVCLLPPHIYRPGRNY